MRRTARQPYERLMVVLGLAAALIWGSVGVRTMVMGHDPSIKALVACGALALVGFALGPVTWMLTAPLRAKRPPSDSTEMRGSQVMLGIMVIGMGAAPITDLSTSAWDWALLVVASLAGGLNLGIAFMTNVAQPGPSGASYHSTAARPSGDQQVHLD